MRKHIVFRPRISEVLESRAVPTVTGVVTPTGLLGLSVTLPGQVAISSSRVQAAFAAFDQSYLAAVDNVLLAPGPDGLVVPSANREAFDLAIEGSLVTLANDLVGSLGGTTAGSTAATQVVDAIVGPDSTSLESQLLALPTTTVEVALPPTANVVSVPAVVSNIPLLVSTAEQVRPTLRPTVTSDGLGGSTTANPSSTASSSPSTPATGASQAIRSAFGNFLNDYFRAVQGVLLAPDATGQVSPQAHRAAFDAQVGQALQSLETRLASTLIGHPATSSLDPQVKAALEGNGAGSLKNRLANLATPGGSQAAVVRDFTLGSTKAIAQALSLIGADVAKVLGAK